MTKATDRIATPAFGRHVLRRRGLREVVSARKILTRGNHLQSAELGVAGTQGISLGDDT
jgi:hypothetical protein